MGTQNVRYLFPVLPRIIFLKVYIVSDTSRRPGGVAMVGLAYCSSVGLGLQPEGLFEMELQ